MTTTTTDGLTLSQFNSLVEAAEVYLASIYSDFCTLRQEMWATPASDEDYTTLVADVRVLGRMAEAQRRHVATLRAEWNQAIAA